jgi:hypothetical protein
MNGQELQNKFIESMQPVFNAVKKANDNANRVAVAIHENALRLRADMEKRTNSGSQDREQ